MVSIGRLKAIMKALFRVSVSEGTIAAAIACCASRLEPTVAAIKTEVKRAPVLHFDEAGMNNQGGLWWLHVASTTLFTYLTIHSKRGTEAMDDAGILPDFTGIAEHDCWKPYWRYPCTHALCNAHLLRELRGIVENTGQVWAQALLNLALEMKEVVALYRQSDKPVLSPYYTREFSMTYDRLVAGGNEVSEGLELNPLASRQPGKRGVAKQSKARLLLNRLTAHKEAYLRFSADFAVPFDNNQAERDIRVSKLKDKISGDFRSDSGAESFAVVQSFIQTTRKQAKSV
jgi:transposase